MKKIFLLLMVLASFATLQAQPQTPKDPSKEKRGPSIEQFLQTKIDFIINDLKLSEADSAKFAPMYRDYQKAKGELMMKANTGRSMGRKMMKKETITDDDYKKAAHGELDFKIAEAELAKSWFTKFETILTPQQLFTLLRAEDHFAAEMMQRHQQRGHGERLAPQEKK